jgi:hypothetical protein
VPGLDSGGDDGAVLDEHGPLGLGLPGLLVNGVDEEVHRHLLDHSVHVEDGGVAGGENGLVLQELSDNNLRIKDLKGD